MRDILFRAKRTDNGAWETGGLVVVRGGCSDEQVFISDKMTGYHTPVLPETVGQFTGVTDKNGIKIFEGDIVKWDYRSSDGKIYQVKYDVCCACFVTSREHKGTIIDTVFENDGYHCEVIGNVHDHPERIKEMKSIARLTSKDEHGKNVIITSEEWSLSENHGTLKLQGCIADKLADYEETGLSPTEISAMKSDNERLHSLLDELEQIINKQ